MVGERIRAHVLVRLQILGAADADDVVLIDAVARDADCTDDFAIAIKREAAGENRDAIRRDGTQGEGISFSVTDKLLIAQRLDAFGVDYIEGGFPGSNPRDITFFNEAKKLKLKHARLAAFGSTRRAGAKANDDAQLRTLIDSGMPVLTIVGKTWTLHVTEILKTRAAAARAG